MLLVVVVVMSACGPSPLPGAPKLGAACDAMTDARECYTEASIAFCDGGKWAEYPCADRCSNAQSPKCELAVPTAGTACPASWDGAGMCGGDVLLLCTDGKWKSCECRSCNNSGVLYCENRFSC